MELGMIIVLVLAGIYTTMLVVGALMEARGEGRGEAPAAERSKTAA
jgi:hypothetical protein